MMFNKLEIEAKAHPPEARNVATVATSEASWFEFLIIIVE